MNITDKKPLTPSKQIVSLVVAMDRKRAIGLNGDLPWRLSSDLQYFKSITMGKPIIMGRKTYESIGRPLPGRRNIVISRNPLFEAPGCDVSTSLEAGIALVDDVPEVMIIGGATLYVEALHLAQRLYITEVDAVVEADTWFPVLDPFDWSETSRESHTASDKNDFDFSFVVHERRSEF